MTTSTLLIQSTNPNNKAMGTGFVIHQDIYGSFILTCAHVIEQVGSPKIDDFEVLITAKGTSSGLDLALLYVKGLFRTSFLLQKVECTIADVELIGYSKFTHDKYQSKAREATISTEVTLQEIGDGDTYKALHIRAKRHHEIESGNSGGPLICKETGKVIAVVSNNRGVDEGYAIAIEHIKDIWDDMPPFLFESEDESRSPFVGLSAFGIEQAHLFFGRDVEIAEIMERLREDDIITVVGDSGSGKSSLIKAGVIPKYLNGVLDGESTHHLIDTRPAQNAFNELANSIEKIIDRYGLDFQSINQLKKAIKSRHSEDILNALEYIFKEDNSTLLIYIDQFEELFTLCEDSIQREFIELLEYLLENQTKNLKIKIVLTIRRDYYNLISEYEEFFKKVQETKYSLRRMDNAQIKECIEKPLERTFIKKDEIRLFSKAVLHDMGDESGELALLQIALTQTWRHKKSFDNKLLATYHEIGEVSGALSKLADDTWSILTPTEQKILKYIFIRIIKPSDTGGVIRRVANREEFSKERWNLAQKLASALDITGQENSRAGRLLTIKGESGKFVELTHEALVRQWPMYQKWLKQASKDNLKRVHDSIIEKSKKYWEFKDKKFLLMGYELEESQRLLQKEYIEYLSKKEIEYIKKSQEYRKRNRFLKIGAVIGVIILLGIIGVLITNQIRQSAISIDELDKKIHDTQIQNLNNRYLNIDIPKTRRDIVSLSEEELDKVSSLSDNTIKQHQSLIKLILLTPNITSSYERDYWLKRLAVMRESTLDKLFKVLQFDAYVNQGNAYFSQAKKQQAIDAYTNANMIKPNEEYLYFYIGNVYYSAGNNLLAIEYYKKVLEINPQNQDAHIYIGNMYNSNPISKYREAIEEFKKVLEINSKSVIAYTGMAISYNFLKEYDKGVEMYKKIVELSPNNLFAYYYIGMGYGMQFKHKEAIEYYQKALKLNPNNETIYFSMGMSYTFLKEYSKAEEMYREVIKINPNNSLAYENISNLKLIQNK